MLVQAQDLQSHETPPFKKDSAAAMNREALNKAHVFAIEMIGPPNCGKSVLLGATLRRLCGRLRVGVIVSDDTNPHDLQDLAPYCRKVVQAKLSGPKPAAESIREALQKVELGWLDVLMIESLAKPHEEISDIGQDARIAVFSVAGGHDKIEKYAPIVKNASAVVLSKVDLFPHVPFDGTAFGTALRLFNPDADWMKLSALNGEGMDVWAEWIFRHRALKLPQAARSTQESPDWFVG